MSSPPTSVVIPAFNAEKYLAEAIGSVEAQGAPTEVIVVDDGSTDGTADVVHRFPGVTYLRQENAGVAAALNHGLRMARGQFVAFVSADDMWVPEKLAWQFAAGAANGLVFGHMQHFVSPELAAPEAAALVCPAEPMPAYSAGTLLTPLATFERVGGFNENFAVGEFMEWYDRASGQGMPAIMLDRVVSRRRVHGANHSTTTLREKSYAPVLHAILARRRARGGAP